MTTPDPITLSFNARRIITTIRAKGPQSRADLARLLTVTPPTTTRLTGNLMDQGLLYEIPDISREGQKGFPSKLLKIAEDGLYSAGVYFDPDRILTCVTDLSGAMLSQDEIPITDRAFAAILSRAGESVAQQIATLGIPTDKLAGCGVSYPGQHTEDPERVLKTLQFADWPNINVERDLSPYFDMPVYHMNDAKAACLAELYYGACRSVPNFCYIWLGYGIGGGAVIEQRPYLGRNAGAAEWGGLFPKSAPRPSGQDLLDTLARSGNPVARLSDLSDGDFSTGAAQLWAARAGGQLQGLCLTIARTFAPEAVVIGGTLNASVIDAFVSRIAEAEILGEDFHVSPPQILRATTDTLPQLGAAALPFHDFLNPAAFAGIALKGW